MTSGRTDGERKKVCSYTIKPSIHEAFSTLTTAHTNRSASENIEFLMSNWITEVSGKEPKTAINEATLKKNERDTINKIDSIRKTLLEHKTYDKIVTYLKEDLKLDLKTLKNSGEAIARLLKESPFNDTDTSLTVSIIELKVEAYEIQTQLKLFRAQKYGAKEAKQ